MSILSVSYGSVRPCLPKLSDFAAMCRLHAVSFSVLMRADQTLAFIPASAIPDEHPLLVYKWNWWLARGQAGLGYYFRLESLT